MVPRGAPARPAGRCRGRRSGYASSVSDRAFARPGSEAPWQPSAADLADARLAGFVRRALAGTRDATADPAGEGLETLQARAVVDPGWFWGAAADDLGVAWQRPPDDDPRPGGRTARARWWIGGAFNHAGAATEPWAAARPDDAALAWEGEDGAVRALTPGPSSTERSAARRAASPRTASGRGPGRDPPADARRDGDRRPRPGPAPGDLHADLQRLRGARRRRPAGRVRGDPPHHRRRLPPARRDRRAQGRGRRGGRARADRPDGRGRPAARSGALDTADRPGRDVDWEPEPAPTEGDGGSAARPTPRSGRRRGPADRSRDAVHGDLHLGHDRPAEGDRPRPRRLPDQGRPGPRPHVRPAGAATPCAGSPTSAG